MTFKNELQCFFKELLLRYEQNGKIYLDEIENIRISVNLSRTEAKNYIELLESDGTLIRRKEKLSQGRPREFFRFKLFYNKKTFKKAYESMNYSLIVFLKTIPTGFLIFYKNNSIIIFHNYSFETKLILTDGKPFQFIPYCLIEKLQNTSCQQEEDFVIGMNFTFIEDVMTEKKLKEKLYYYKS